MISEIHVGSLTDQTGFADDFMICVPNDSGNNGQQQRNQLAANGTHSINLSNSAQNMLQSAKNDLFICPNLAMDEDWPNNTLPTPPRSPENNLNALDDELRDQFDELIGEGAALDLLESMELDLCPIVDDLLATGAWNGAVPNQDPALDNAIGGSQEVRHDCMWSGKCDATCKQRVRYSSENSDIHLLTPASSPLRTSGMATSTIKLEPGTVSDFVDPSAVMSYTPHADHSYYLHEDTKDIKEVVEIKLENPQVTVATSTTPTSNGTWADEQYEFSDSNSESDVSEETESENIEDEEEIDVVSVQSAPVRAHQRSLAAHAVSSQRSLLKTKNMQRTAAHKQRKQKTSASAPATPYLLTPVQSPQPSNPAGPIEYPMPKVTSSGRIVQPTNRSASFLEAQPQHSSRSGGDHHRRKRKSDHTVPSGRSKTSRHNNASSRISDAEDPEKRREHNSMERKRRDDLRSAFQRLRELVPDVSSCPKAAKVVILAKAADYSKRLQKDCNQFEAQKHNESEKNKNLQRTLHALRRQLQRQHHQQLPSHSQHRGSSQSPHISMRSVPS